MSLRSTLVLLLLLGALGGAWFLVDALENGGDKPGPVRTERVWPEAFRFTELEKMTFINMERGLFEEMRFARQGVWWNMVYPRRDWADRARVEGVLFALSRNRYNPVGRVGELGPEVLGQYGLADGKGKAAGRGFLALQTPHAAVEVWIGGPTVDGRETFVRVGDRVWRTGINLWSSFGYPVEGYRSTQVWRSDLDRIGTVVLERRFDAGGKPRERLEFRRQRRGEWQLVEEGMVSRADPRAVTRLVGYLLRLRVNSCVGDLPADLSLQLLAPPFYRIRLAGAEREETLDLGKATEVGVLGHLHGRPYLLEVGLKSGDPLYPFLQGRGTRTRGTGVDYRFRRPLGVEDHTIRSLRVRRGGAVWYELTRDNRGDFRMVHPLRWALRAGAAEGLVQNLVTLEALNSYPKASRGPELTGLDRPTRTVELEVKGAKEPRVLHLGRSRGKGVYGEVVGEPVVWFLPGDKVDALLPAPVTLLSRKVILVPPAQAQVVVLEGGGRTTAWHRDTRRNLYLDAKGGEAPEALDDLLDSVLELSAVEVVDLTGRSLEEAREAWVLRFHRFHREGAAGTPGPLQGRLVVAREGGRILATSNQAPGLLFRLPERVWKLLGAVAGAR